MAQPTNASVLAMIAYGDKHGFIKGLCYRIARGADGTKHDYLVCVHCGWAWAGVNRCLNPECRGFSTWGEAIGTTPSSFVPTPDGGLALRAPGQDSPGDHEEQVLRIRRVLKSIES